MDTTDDATRRGTVPAPSDRAVWAVTLLATLVAIGCGVGVVVNPGEDNLLVFGVLLASTLAATGASCLRVLARSRGR